MLLSEILFEIDTEIERLTQVKEILASLNLPSTSVLPTRTPKPSVAAPEPAPVEVAEPVEPVEVPIQPTILRPRVRRERWVRASRHRATVERAIGGAIPTAPVVVRAAEVAQHEAEKAQAIAVLKAVPPPVQEGTLDSLLKQLGHNSPQL